jgi:hypothetical protein
VDYSSQTVSALITVTPAVLTVTANNFVVAYGAADPAYTAAITGLVNGDSLATAVTGTPALSSTATITSPVGSYPITAAVGTLAAKNYSFVYVAGTLTVTQASGYTVSWKPATVVYGASTVGSGTLVATSSIAGSFSYSPALGTVLGVGTTTVTATFTPTDSVDYSSQTVSALITVTPAVLTVTANNFVVAYGAADPAYTAAITGLVNGDSLATAVTGTPALSSTATITSPVGSYPITAAGRDAGGQELQLRLCGGHPDGDPGQRLHGELEAGDGGLRGFDRGLGHAGGHEQHRGQLQLQPCAGHGAGRGHDHGDRDLYPHRQRGLQQPDGERADHGDPGGADGDGQ